MIAKWPASCLYELYMPPLRSVSIIETPYCSTETIRGVSRDPFNLEMPAITDNKCFFLTVLLHDNGFLLR